MRLLRRRVLILEGAMALDQPPRRSTGRKPSSSVLNVLSPASVLESHEQYVAAGSDIILTNTLGANERNLSSKELKKVIRQGVILAKRAAKDKYVFGSVGPLGDHIRPYGAKGFEDVVTEYRRIFMMFAQSGLRWFFLTDFTTLIEAKAAFLAAREYSECTFVCFSLKKGYGIMGESPEAIALTIEALGADGVGVSCTPPETIVEVLSKMRKVSCLPLIAKPNAGKVTMQGGVTHYSMQEADLVSFYPKFVGAGASIIGGCCGTSPDYIRAIAEKGARAAYRRKFNKMFRLASPVRIAEFLPGRTYVVGERLNPTGRKKLRADLKSGTCRAYGDEAKDQELAGSDAIDINAFVDVLDERATLLNAVHAVMKHSSLPLFIDTQNYEAAEIVFRSYPGIGVCNSIPARRNELRRWLPMVRRYGFKAVISLVGKRLPVDCQERIENARLVIKVARELHFPIDDLIFDPLVLPIATEQVQASETLKALNVLHRMKLRTILGVSNVSYGLPDRSQLNIVMTVAAAFAHATFVIVNPLDPRLIGAISTANAIIGSAGVLEYIERYRAAQRAKGTKSAK